MSHPPSESLLWWVVVPVKPLAVAKSRLGRVGADLRAELALAFALDTVRAALACGRVEGALVVTDDPQAAEAVARLGATVVPDKPDAGLNPALRYGAARVTSERRQRGVAALSADLPALRPEELGRALAAAQPRGRAFVADRAGVGTTLLTAGPGLVLAPAFGPRSRAGHRAAGAYELTLSDIPSVRADVDTLEDLEEASRLRVGPETSRLLEGLPAADRPG